MTAAQHSAPNTAFAELALEAALAARVYRSARVPDGLLEWLSHAVDLSRHADPQFTAPRATNTDDFGYGPRQHISDPLLVAALDEIIGPLSSKAPKSRRRQAHSAAQWLAVACSCCAEQSSRLGLAIGPRLLAASLLPLYRCLGTGDLGDGLRQAQLSLRELLCLLVVCQEVGPALVEVLDSHSTSLDCPHVVLSREFGLSLPHLAQMLGEVCEASDQSAGTPGRDLLDEPFSQAAIGRLQTFDPSTSHLSTPVWAAPELLWNLAGELTSGNSELSLPKAWIDLRMPWNQVVDHWHTLLHLVSGQLLPNAAIDGDRYPPPQKVLISEILTHNDLSFVNVIRRQIGKCRSQGRALSLVSLVVSLEDTGQGSSVTHSGLNVWQQKLVRWLADQPQVVEPHAFLTGDDELLLCILDLERNETTALLRHGLVEVLTGRQFDDSQGNLLAQVDTPASYHAGIASTSSPGARFLPEQLIDPAIRCLSAARRHGRASIKSIEVY